MGMNQCPRCGNAINTQSRFCPHCAFDFSQSLQPGYGNLPQAAAPALQCYACGATLSAGLKFCPHCATPVQQPPAYPQPVYAQPAPMYAPQPYAAPAPKKSRKGLIIGIIALFLIGGLAGAYILGSRLLSPPNQTTEYIRAMEKGDDLAVLGMLSKSNAKLADIRPTVAEVSKYIKENGGVSDILIDKEDVSDSVATIVYTIKLGNGTTKNGTLRYVKEDRKWKVLEGETLGFSRSPSSVVKDFVLQVEKGNIDAAVNLFSSKMPNDQKEKLKTLLPAATQELKKKGGVKSVEIEKEDVKGDAAEVKYKIVYGNGTEDKNQNGQLVKENGEWKLTG